MNQDSDKRAAAEAAVEEVRSGMRVGLGTGSTAAFAIAAIGARVQAGLRITAVATSIATEALARDHGIPVLAFDDVAHVDLTIDGVDAVDPMLRAIKGGGGAMLREKIVASASTRMIAIADATKPVPALAGNVPIEILPFARSFVLRAVADLGATPVPRIRDGDPVRSDQGNLLIDAGFGAIPDPAALAARLDAIPGLLGHGLFLGEIDALYVADRGVVTRHNRP